MPLRMRVDLVKRSKVRISHDVIITSLYWDVFHTEVLVHILEVLGTHSIQTAELKQVIGALRPLQNGQLVSNVVSPTSSPCHPPTPSHPHSPPTTTVSRKLSV